MIAEGFARLPRDYRFKSNALSVVRSLVDHNLALTVSLCNLAEEYAKQRPIQACERRVVEMAFDNGADVGELTIAMCRGLVELTAAAHGTIAVVVGMAHEFPLVRHLGNLPRLSQSFGMIYELIDLCLSLLPDRAVVLISAAGELGLPLAFYLCTIARCFKTRPHHRPENLRCQPYTLSA